MEMDARAKRQPPFARSRFLLGLAAAIGLFCGLAEILLRLSPPRDLCPYLGSGSPLTGHYKPDPDFSVSYLSWQAFYTDNTERLAGYFPVESHEHEAPIWMLFGNSFVQAPGMLGDHVVQNVRDKRVLFLGRNEHPFVRMAQIKLLLEAGLKPERIFYALMPVDVIGLGEQPLATHRVTPGGGLGFEPRLPAGPVGSLVSTSRLALTAWSRAGRQKGNIHFDRRALARRLDEPLLGDLTRLFANLARVARSHGVPVTVLLIPSHEQIHGMVPCGFQDTLAPRLRDLGFDLFDPREAFTSQTNLPALFIPDKHFSALGNRVLLHALLQHVNKQGSLAKGATPPSGS